MPGRDLSCESARVDIASFDTDASTVSLVQIETSEPNGHHWGVVKW